MSYMNPINIFVVVDFSAKKLGMLDPVIKVRHKAAVVLVFAIASIASGQRFVINLGFSLTKLSMSNTFKRGYSKMTVHKSSF